MENEQQKNQSAARSANLKYRRENYQKMVIEVRREIVAEIKQAASRAGLSINAYVTRSALYFASTGEIPPEF